NRRLRARNTPPYCGRRLFEVCARFFRGRYTQNGPDPRMPHSMKPRRVTILRKGLLVLALPLVYQALFIGLLMKRQADHNETQRLAVHTKNVLLQTDEVYRLLLLAQNNLRAYVLTEDSAFADEALRSDPV